MRYWTLCYPGEVGQLVRETFSEDQIIESYYDYWSKRMMLKEHDPNLDHARCIEDWKTIHWAVETNEFGEKIDQRND